MSSIPAPTYDPDVFTDEYKLATVLAYPRVSLIERARLWTTTLEEREAAFVRCLGSPRLARAHDQHLRLAEHRLIGETR